jgi:TP901 family phage tail tape measure protein
MMALSLLVKLRDMLTGPSAKTNQALKTLRESVDRTKRVEAFSALGSSMQQKGTAIMATGALVTGAGKVMRGAFSGLAQPLHEFEGALAAVRTVAPGTFGSVQADMRQVTGAAREWARSHSDSASSYAKASYMMLSSGLDMRAAIAGTSTAMTVAKATMGDGQETASLLATVYANMGSKTADVTGEMTRLGDVLAKTQQMFKFPNLAVLTEGLKYGVPVAKQYGMSMEQLSAVIGTLNDAGIEGGMAGTTLAATMRQMNKASKELGFGIARTADGGVDLIGTMSNLQAKFGSKMKLPAVQEAFQKAFGDEGLKGVTLLMGKVDRMQGAMGGLKNAAGTAAAAAKIMEDTPAEKMKRFQNVIDDLKMTLAAGLTPALEKVRAVLTWAADGLRSFAEKHPLLTKLAGGFAVVLMGVVSIVGPIMLAGGALIWLAGGVVTARGKIEKWVGTLRAAGSALKSFAVSAWNTARTALVALWQGFLRLVPAIWNTTVALLANPITWIVVGIMALVAAIVLVITHWGRFKAAFASAWEAIKGFFGDIWGWIAGLAGKFWDAAVSLWDAFIDGVKSIAGKVWATVKGVFGWIADLFPHSDARKGPLHTLTASGRSLLTTWAAGMRRGVPALRAALGGAMQLVDGALGALSPSLPDLRGSAEWLVKPLQTPDLPDLAGEFGLRAGGSRGQAGKQVVINGGLHVELSGGSAQDREGFIRMLRGLGEQYA